MKNGRKDCFMNFCIFLLFWPYFIVDNDNYTYFKKMSINNIKENGKQRKISKDRQKEICLQVLNHFLIFILC